MQLISVLMFIISSNLDNLVIGLSYGLKKIEINPASNLLVGLITLVGTLAAMGFGKFILRLLPAAQAEMLGSAAMLLMGVYFLVSYCRKDRKAASEPNWPHEHPERFDRDRSQTIDLREAAVLGIALAVNNVGLGIGASIMGLNLLVTSLGSCLCSLLCLYAGNKVGRGWVSGAVGRYAEPLSGVLIILMALFGLLR